MLDIDYMCGARVSVYAYHMNLLFRGSCPMYCVRSATMADCKKIHFSIVKDR